MDALKPITSLADLTKLTKAALSGGLGSQEFFYKAEEVEALVAHLGVKAYPSNLTPDLAEVLGWPNFKCGPFAQAFRAAGYEIATKAEAEQAFVLHWLTGIVLKHGTNWRQYAAQELEAVRAKASQGKEQASA